MASKKKSKVRSELSKLYAQKRRAVRICIIGAAAVVLVTVIRQALGFAGIAPFGNTPVDTVMFVLCLGVCFVAGPQFSLYLRLKRQIQDAEAKIAE